MKTSAKIVIGTLAALGIAAGSVAFADDYGPMKGPGYRGYGPNGHCQKAGPGARLDRLKAELKLTAKQEPAWQAFEKAVQANKPVRGEGRAAMAGGADPMQTRIAFMEQRLAAMKAIQKARVDLYKALTPEQKKAMDEYGPGYGPGYRHYHRHHY